MQKVKIILTIFTIVVIASIAAVILAENRGFNKKELLDTDNLNKDLIINILGEPDKYIWGEKVLNKDNLPTYYCMDYGNGNIVFIGNDRLIELRVHAPGNFIDPNGVSIGDSSYSVFKKIGKPISTVENRELSFKDSVYYKNYYDKASYYSVEKKGVRMFFYNDRISAIYITGNFTLEILEEFSSYVKKSKLIRPLLLM